MSQRKRSPHKRSTLRSQRTSGIIGGALLTLAILWLFWILTNHGGGNSGLGFTLPSFSPPVAQVPPLVAAGVTLAHSDQTPALSQQQALLLAKQLEPEAASGAKKVGAQYILLNYLPMSPSASSQRISNTPAWLIFYQTIPLGSNDSSADPNSTSISSHDLYVFLDASSGKELLKVWA